jgi:STE24 endopeptidase
VAAIAATTALLAGLVISGGSIRLREAAGGSVAGYVLLLALIQEVVTLPLAWYRGYRLERQYDLSRMSAATWFLDHFKASAMVIALAVAAAEGAYLAMRFSPEWWWIATAIAAWLLLIVLTYLAPVFVLPLFHRSRPLGRDDLRQRLIDLATRAGVPVLRVYELDLGDRTQRANAALVGAGSTRRILLSTTLLAEYTDEEIEVVTAHEIGHHVHRDVRKGLAAELVVLLAALYGASQAAAVLWRPLGLQSPEDIAALPLMLIAAGAVSLAATPLMNAWSRRNERRADRFALELTSRPEAFIAAMRRMAAQNLAEEHPTFAARWLLNTHPTVDERIAGARRVIEAETAAAAQGSPEAHEPSAARRSRSSAEVAGV